MKKPKVVCLCGSTKFLDLYREVTFWETLAGNIVLSVGGTLKRGLGYDDLLNQLSTEEIVSAKIRLDELHLRKIDMADEIIVLSKAGYIGESTAREIAYATSLGKPVKYFTDRDSCWLR